MVQEQQQQDCYGNKDYYCNSFVYWPSIQICWCVSISIMCVYVRRSRWGKITLYRCSHC